MKEQALRKRRETRKRRISSNRSTHTGGKKGLKNRAVRGQYVSKEGPIPGRDPSSAFPVCPVRSAAAAAAAGMFLPEPGEGFITFCFQHSSPSQRVHRAHRVLAKPPNWR